MKHKIAIIPLFISSAFHATAEGEPSPGFYLSPTISLTQYAAEIKQNEKLSRGHFNSSELSVYVGGHTAYQKTAGVVSWLKTTSPPQSSGSRNELNYRLSQTWANGQSSPYRLTLSTKRDTRFEGDLSRGLLDDIYQTNEAGNEKQHSALFSYKSHPGAIVDLSTDISGSTSRYENKEKTQRGSDSKSIRMRNSLGKSFNNIGADFELSQTYEKQWQDGTVQTNARFEQSGVRLEIGKKLHNQLSLVTNHEITEYKAPGQNQENEQRYEINGAGLRWSSVDNSKRVTVRRDYDTKEKEWSWGARIEASMKDRYQFYGAWEKRFYGESGELRLSATFNKRTFSVSSSKDVDFRYLNAVEQVFTGLYLCNEGVQIFDPDNCALPDDGVIQLEPGQSLVPRFESNTFLNPRITLRTQHSIVYDEKFSTWSLQVKGLIYKDRDNLRDISQEGKDLNATLKKEISENETLSFSATRRIVTLYPSAEKPRDWVFETKYTKQVNESANWSVSFQTGQQDERLNYAAIKEKRVSINYQINFGSKHPNRKRR